jgi:hypothetical protein
MSKKDTKMAEKFRQLAVVEDDYAVKLDGEVRGYGNEVLRDIVGSVAVDRKSTRASSRPARQYPLEGLSLTEDEYNELIGGFEKHTAVRKHDQAGRRGSREDE